MARMITVKQLADRIGMSESWIYANLSDIPHFRFKGAVRFNGDEVDKWLEGQKSSPETPGEDRPSA